MTANLPEARKVIQLLTNLLGCDVPFAEAEPTADYSKGYAAACHNAEGDPIIAFVADPRAGAFLGGKLMMLPVGRLEEAAASGELDEELIDALSEVFNNLTVPLNAIENNPHIASRPVASMEVLTAEDTTEWLASPGTRLELTGDVLGGEARFAVLIKG